MIATPEIGRVGTSHRLRNHAIIDDTAPCHAGIRHGKIVPGTTTRLTDANAGRFCRTRACRRALAAQLVQAANTAAAAPAHTYDAESAAVGRLAVLFPPDRVPAPDLTESPHAHRLRVEATVDEARAVLVDAAKRRNWAWLDAAVAAADDLVNA